MTHLEYFYEISKIPRPSGEEEKIADYLCEFAEKHGLQYYRDKGRNVLINKPASKGYENAPCFCLQGHTDMVCEKELSSDHDFTKDPIDIYVEDGKLKAHGTTLGGDDGAAISIMLALLSGDYKTPRLQCLFTAEEETGLFGAGSFDYSLIDAEYMINIDGEEEDEILASCAGGLRAKLVKSYPTSDANECFKITISGLAGGHSGADIHKNRANASLLMFRLISKLSCSNIRLAFFEGGSKENAITPYATAVVECDKDVLKKAASEFKAEILKTLTEEDKNFDVTVEEAKSAAALSVDATRELASLAQNLKSGVIRMSEDVQGLVSTSSNLGVVKVENGTAKLYYSVRSEDDDEKQAVWAEYEEIANESGYTAERGQEYPGWKFRRESHLRTLYADAYKTVAGRDIKVNAIHAGLECGIISGALPELDIIAIGPNMEYVHTTAEAMDIDSFTRVFETIKLCLERAKDI